MAGSRAWFNYVSDNGVAYAVELDEDAGTLAAFGFTAYTDGAPHTTLPSGYKMRYVNASQISGNGAGFVSRQFSIGTPTTQLYTGATSLFSVNNLNYAVSSSKGEKQRRPKAANTGLVGNSPTVGGQA